MPDVYAEYRVILLENAYLLIEGELQNIDNVVTVKVSHMVALHVAEEACFRMISVRDTDYRNGFTTLTPAITSP